MAYTSDLLDPKRANIVLWLIALAFFMQMLDGTILNIALPGIARDLGVNPLQMQSVVIAYMLTTALFIPASGWCADHFGTKNVFFAAISLFTLGSFLCAISPTLPFLAMARIVQGLGGALLVPVGRLTVLKVFPRSQLVGVLSFVTLPGLLGPLIGPIIGGFLVEYASWHWIFLINIPIGIIGAVFTLRCFPQLTDSEAKRFDLIGFLLFGLSMILISIAMEGFGELHMSKVMATTLCISGLILMSLYWLRSAYIQNPLFACQLFQTRSFAIGILGSLFGRLGTGAMPYLIPLFLQLALGFSPFIAGISMIPAALGGLIGKQIIDQMVKRFGFRHLLTANTLIQGIIFACFAIIDADTSIVVMMILFGLFGIVNSMQFTATNSMTLIDLPTHHTGSGNSLLSVVMQVASSTGVAMAAALISGFAAAGSLGLDTSQMAIFHHTFIVVGLIVCLTTLIFNQTPDNVGQSHTGTIKVVDPDHDSLNAKT